MVVSLRLKFNPKELGPEKTGKLLGDLVGAVANVLTPAQRAELLRKFEAERERFARGSRSHRKERASDVA